MKFYIIPNDKELDKYKEELILPLENYSIGFDTYFNVKEIENISKTRPVNVIINTFLHKNDIESIKKIINSLSFVKYFFIEDLGLLNIINNEKVVINQCHIINNYNAINYYNELGKKNIVISNELTIEEIEEIKSKSTSNLFYFLINRNMLMYSKRKLINSYYNYKNINNDNYIKEIEECVSKKHLIIKEEEKGTLIFDKNIFSANEFLDSLTNINLIINLSNLNKEETNIVLSHYKDKNLKDFIKIDNYFAVNKIGYKVGDIK